jgi:tetratricopeptide (TPR) repeat protein
MPATGSRTAWIAVAFAVSLIACIEFFGSSKVTALRNYLAKRALQVTAFTAVCLIVVIGAALKLYHMKQASADGRVLIWKVSLMAGNENYQTGVGLGYFPGAFGSNQAKYFQSDHDSLKESQLADSPAAAFNEYLQIYVETGIVGILTFILMISFSFFDGLRYNNLSGLGALTSFIFVSFTSYPFSQIGFLVLFVLVLIFTTHRRGNVLATVDKKKLSPGVVISILIIALSTSILTCIRGAVTYGALQKWENAKLLFYSKKYDEALGLYKAILPVLSDQPELLFEYGECLSRTERFAESNRILGLGTQISSDPMFYNIIGRNLQAIKQYGAAEIYLRKSMYMVPNRLYPRYLLAKLYIEIGDVDKAKKMAKWVLSNDAKVSSSAADDIKKEMEDLLSKHYL